MNDEYKRHLKGTLWSGIGLLPARLQGIILIPILTKMLGVAFYGEYVSVLTVISLISGVSDLGLGTSLSRFFPSVKGTDEGARTFYTVLWVTAFANGIVFLVVGLGGRCLAPSFHLPSEIAFHIAAAIALYSVYGVVVEFYRASELMSTYVLIGGFRNLAEMTVIAVIAIFVQDLKVVVEGIIMVNLVALVVVYLSVRERVGRVHAPDSRIKKLLVFSLPLVPTRVADWVVNLSDRLLIGLFLGQFAVGLYNTGYALGTFILVVATIEVTMLPPLLARLYDTGKRSMVDDIVAYSLKYFLILAVPVLGGLVAISKQLLLLISNQIIADQAFAIPPIVAFGALLYGCYYILLQVLQVKLRTKRIATAVIVGAISNLVLNVLFIRAFGIITAAVSTTIAFGISFIIVFVGTGIGLRGIIQKTRVANIALSSSLMAASLIFVNERVGNMILLDLIVAAVSYPLCLIVFDVFDEKERGYFGGIVKRLVQGFREV